MSNEYVTLYKFNVSVNEYLVRHYGYYLSKEFGKEDVKGKGWYGSDGRFSNTVRGVYVEVEGKNMLFLAEDAITLQEDSEEVKESVRKYKRRQKLLAEMSDEDKEIIGLMERK